MKTGGSWLWQENFGLAGAVIGKTSLSAAYAREQGGDKSDRRWEIEQGLGAIFSGLNYSILMGRVALASVSPIVDTARAAAVGPDLHDYRRWEGEIVFNVNVNAGKWLRKIEFNHREFREVSAPAAVKTAGLDRFKLSTIYLGADDGLFVAFSKGGLPADREDSRTIQIGWSTNIGK